MVQLLTLYCLSKSQKLHTLNADLEPLSKEVKPYLKPPILVAECLLLFEDKRERSMEHSILTT